MELLKKLTQIDSPSGCEESVRSVIEKEIEKYCTSVQTDAMGNLIAYKKGDGKVKLMVAAHMDEIGVMATGTDEHGFIRFSPVGGLYTKELVHRKVRFLNGTIGVIGSEEEEFNKKPAVGKLYIDIGAKSKSDAQRVVKTGDCAVFAGEFSDCGETVVSKALDNRAGCYVLIESLKKIKNNKADIYFVFTVQEEVGLRGAKPAAFSVNPDYAIAVDVTDTGDTPKAPVMEVKLGGGAAVKVMDRSIMCSAEVREMMINTAKKKKIPYQLEIMADGGTDAGAIHLTGSGAKTGGISIPTRYIHSPAEMADKSDIENCIKLLAALCECEWK